MGEKIEHSLAIIGGGPAGLAASRAARDSDYVLLESGPDLPHRRADDASTAASGIGGAGLYSDGKFSFWPSATKLWALNRDSIEASWAFLEEILPSEIIGKVRLQDAGIPPSVIGNELLAVKSYPSFYVSPEDRLTIIDDLASHVRNVRTGDPVTSLSKARSGWSLKTAKGHQIDAAQVIVATGRFSLIGLRNELNARSKTQRRLEVGVRIEQPSDQFFLADQPALDPKLILSSGDPRLQWRTFCCCRQGLVVPTWTAGLFSVSGRADCPPTGRSNAGFNVRILDADLAQEVWQELLPRLFSCSRPATELIGTFGNAHSPGPLAELLGSQLTEWLVEGLGVLGHAVGSEALRNATLIGPTLEGVVTYLSHDENLAVPGAEGLWVAGDAAGDFRGLTAALMSGYIAGQGSLSGADS